MLPSSPRGPGSASNCTNLGVETPPLKKHKVALNLNGQDTEDVSLDFPEWNGSVFKAQIPKEEVSRRWPKRRVASSAADARTHSRAVLDRASDGVQDQDAAAAVAHFRRLEFEGDGDLEGQIITVEIGDHVECGGENKGLWILQVLELFEDVNGSRWVSGSWYYKPEETPLLASPKRGESFLPIEMDRQLLFRAAVAENGVCKCCVLSPQWAVEDEDHFLSDCPLYSQIREQFQEEIFQGFVDRNISQNFLAKTITSDALFLHKCMELRKEFLGKA